MAFMTPMMWLTGALGAAGVATQYMQGQSAKKMAQQQMEQQAAAQAEQKRQAEASLAANREALQVQISQQTAAREQQAAVYQQQLEQSAAAQALQQKQFEQSSLMTQASMSQAAAAQAEQTALQRSQLKKQEEALNKANQKTPDTAQIDAENSNRRGNAGTLLTGALGIDKDKQLLGRSALLGG